MTSLVRKHVNRPWLVSTLAALLISLGAAGNVWATSINVDFVCPCDVGPSPQIIYGAAAGQAGVWNERVAPTAPVPLLDTSGNFLGVFMSVVADLNNFQNPNAVVGNDANLLSDYFYTVNGGAYSVNFTGLQNGTYNVFLYAPNASNVAIGSGNVNGVPYPYTGSSVLQFPLLIQGVNYVVVNGVVVSNGTMSILSNGGAAIDNFGLSGLQLQLVTTTIPSVPEPTTVLLVGSGLAFAIRRRLQQKR